MMGVICEKEVWEEDIDKSVWREHREEKKISLFNSAFNQANRLSFPIKTCTRNLWLGCIHNFDLSYRLWYSYYPFFLKKKNFQFFPLILVYNLSKALKRPDLFNPICPKTLLNCLPKERFEVWILIGAEIIFIFWFFL